MRVQDLEFGRQVSGMFDLAGAEVSEMDVGRVIALLPQPDIDALLLALDGERIVEAKPLDKRAWSMLDEVRGWESSTICHIASVDEKAFLKANIFSTNLYLGPDEPLSLVISEAVIGDIPVKHKSNPIQFLRDNLLIGDTAFLAGQSQRLQNSFRLMGVDWVCDVKMDTTGVFYCYKLVKRRRGRQADLPITLCRGYIDFVDGSIEGNPILRQRISELVDKSGGYLALWDLYNQLEKKVWTQESIEMGCIKYTGYEPREVEDGYEFVFKVSGNLSPLAYKQNISLEAAEAPFSDVKENGEVDLPEKRVYAGELIPAAGTSTVIRTRIDPANIREYPPDSGYLMRGMRAVAKSQRRREMALKRVRQLKTPLLTLGELLEEQEPPTKMHRHQSAASQRVQQVVGYPLTKSQRDALDVALNTPDMAIIQGPPGTGKTTVIKALLTRLAEISEKKGDQASILISTYQHDALDHVIAGSNIKGLPPYRLGGKWGKTKEEKDRVIWEWVEVRQQESARVLEEMKNIHTHNIARDVQRRIEHWRRIRGTETSVANLLSDILSLTGSYLRVDLAEKMNLVMLAQEKIIARCHKKLEVADPALLDRLHKLLEAQPENTVLFQENGPGQALRLVKFLEGVGKSLKIILPKVLHQVADMEAPLMENLTEELFTSYLAGLRDIASQALSSAAEEPVEINYQELDAILDEVIDFLYQQEVIEQGKQVDILRDFLEALEDPDIVRSIVRKYTGVVAATCQQIDSSEHGFGDKDYDVVIIDEAARANPLDILIPMSRGKKIILVGDHKQLPHILERKVVEDFTKQNGEEAINFLKESMFERLFRSFSKAEKKNGIKRVATLLDDFRMHPVISQFVSSTFYPGVGIEAKCTREQLNHQMDLYGGRPVAWIDLPGLRGMEAGGISKHRPVEVDCLEEELMRVININEHYSIGVITFYSLQEQKIQERLKNMPLDWRRRITVGTVDAFQGLEFDVVFLSAVRSNTYRDDINKRVGFLAITNRMCVALSRARRLLVVIGDTETVAGSKNSIAVPELQAFHELCLSEEGWYERR